MRSNIRVFGSDPVILNLPVLSKAMIIDVGELSKASSEMALVSGLATQTGYWPVFSFLNSLNNMIDLASVGVIGQKGAHIHTRSIPEPCSHISMNQPV